MEVLLNYLIELFIYVFYFLVVKIYKEGIE